MKAGQRVRLIKTLAPEKLPLGTLGTVLDSSDLMEWVRWDNGMEIPMFKRETEAVEEDEG